MDWFMSISVASGLPRGSGVSHPKSPRVWAVIYGGRRRSHATGIPFDETGHLALSNGQSQPCEHQQPSGTRYDLPYDLPYQYHTIIPGTKQYEIHCTWYTRYAISIKALLDVHTGWLRCLVDGTFRAYYL